jgi:hypothetical protein
MNPIEILSAAPRGAIVARETRESGGGAEGAAEAFAALLEELSGGVARDRAEAGPEAEGEAGEPAAVPAVVSDAAEVPEGAVVLPDAVMAELRPEMDPEAPPAPRSDAGPVEPAAEGREGDAPVDPPELARRGVTSRVAEALWNAVFGIAPAAPGSEVPVTVEGEPLVQVVPRADAAQQSVPVADAASQVAVPPARPESPSTGGSNETEGAEASEGRVPPADRPVAEPSRPVQAGGAPVAAPPVEAASAAVPPAPKAEADDEVREPSDPAGRGVTAERVAPTAPVPANPAPPAPGAVAHSPALVEVAASPALEGWRLEAEPGARTSAAEAAAAARPMPPAQQIVAQLTVAIQRAPGDRVEIRLDPPELGRVQIELSTRDGVLHATVISERPEVHDLMRRHAEMLRQELAAAGHAGVRLEFATGSGQGEGGREAQDPQQVTTRERDAAGPVASAPIENPIDRRPRLAGGRLDIRL